MAISEEKQKLIRKRIAQGRPIAEIAEEVGVSAKTVQRWKKKTPEAGTGVGDSVAEEGAWERETDIGWRNTPKTWRGISSYGRKERPCVSRRRNKLLFSHKNFSYCCNKIKRKEN